MFTRRSFLLVALVTAFLSPPLTAGTRLIFPRILLQKGRWSGIAVANPTNAQVDVAFKAWNADGTAFSGGGVLNPATQKINASSQYVKLATEIFFATGVPAQYAGTTPTRIWVEATSTADGLTGFYLEGDDAGSFMDGSDLSGSGTDLIIPIIENTSGSVSEISIVNPNPETSSQATLNVSFHKEDGSLVVTKSRTIPPSGAVQGPLSELFSDVDFSQVHSLRIRGDRPIAANASIFQPGSKALITIAAQNAAVPAKTLYFPQLAEGAGWSTSVGIQNMTGSDILATFTAYDSDGKLFAPPFVKQNPVTQTIKANGVLHARMSDQDRPNWFGFAPTDPNVPLQGWLKVEASDASINGFVEYSAGDNRALVPAQSRSLNKAIFSFQVQTAGYFTGLAILNPGSVAANVEITSLAGNSSPHGKTQLALKPGQKISKLLYELVKESTGAANGSVFVKSDGATVATQLFGTSTFSALANVAPQEVTTDWDPGALLGKLSLAPQLSVVETGKTKTFSVAGVNAGPVTWISETGGGTITSTSDTSASFQAPSTAPARHNLTILARSDSRSAGATVDVVKREQLTGGLTLLTAVAYLENLSRFFIAEQQILSLAPTIGYAAGSSNAKVSRFDPGASTPVPLATIPGDTISKMLPFSEGGKDYLVLAGYDSGKIYRLDVSSKVLATAAAGLNKPASLAFDPATGNLLVAEATQISVVQRSNLTAAAEPGADSRAGIPWRRRHDVISGIVPQGIAVDNCSGAIYASMADGTIQEFKGAGKKIVRSGLIRPKQIQVVYREGLPCTNGVALAVAEAAQISLIYPATGLADALIAGVQSPQDITFLPGRNPYTSAGEASVGIAEGPQGAGLSQISSVAVGGIYQAAPPSQAKTKDQASGAFFVPYEDPAGDTFNMEMSKLSGMEVPDILSVGSYRSTAGQVIWITFSFPVVPIDPNADPYSGKPNPPNSIDGCIYIETGTASGISLQTLAQYQPLGQDTTFSPQYVVNLASATISAASGIPAFGESPESPYGEYGDPVPVSFLGNTVSVVIPGTTISAPQKARIVILIRNQSDYTDVAPNAGTIKLAQ